MSVEVDRHGSTRSGAAKMVREMDVDGDGLISKAEFCAILAEAANADSLLNYDMRAGWLAVDEELTPLGGRAAAAPA